MPMPVCVMLWSVCPSKSSFFFSSSWWTLWGVRGWKLIHTWPLAIYHGCLACHCDLLGIIPFIILPFKYISDPLHFTIPSQKFFTNFISSWFPPVLHWHIHNVVCSSKLNLHIYEKGAIFIWSGNLDYVGVAPPQTKVEQLPILVWTLDSLCLLCLGVSFLG